MDTSKVKDVDRMGKGMNRNGIRITSHKPVVHSRNAEGNNRPGAATRRTDKVTSGESRNRRNRSSVFGAFLSVLITAVMISSFTLGIFADDAVNQKTVPSDEGYSSTINNIHGRTYTNVTDSDGHGVYQSNSPSSITSFGSALPLSTIYINQDKIWADQNGARPVAEAEFKLLTTAPGIVHYADAATSPTGKAHYVAYNPNASGAIALLPDQKNVLSGDLFSFTFPEAAEYTDANGNLKKGSVVFTYSNAEMFVDYRYKFATNGKLNGLYSLATGAQPTWGTDDSTNLSAYNSRVNQVLTAIRNRTGEYDDGGSDDVSGATNWGSTANPCAQVGGSIDIRISVVDDEGVPVPGTFALATTGINLDRSPRRNSGTNVNRAMWYYYKDYPEYYYFSEAMSINSGMYSQNAYVRNNDTSMSDGKKSGFYPNVLTDSNDNIKFLSDYTADNGSSDGTYTSGFVLLGNAATGISVTSTGHAGSTSNSTTTGLATRLSAMNSPFFNSTPFWYKYKSSTGPHGNIQITQEGNANGDLSLTGSAQDAVLGQGTYVVMEGKTVTYTMTPDIGYKIKKLTVNGSEVKYDSEAVSKMKKGDTVTVTTAAGHDGVLKYEEDGTYTFKFVYAQHDEEIHVEWEPTTADVLVAKRWQDENDKDGLRAAATMPNVKLQYSTNRGRTWTDVTDKVGNYNIADFADPVTQQTVPDGNFLDGSYDINNDQTGRHPYTWEYLPVYTYDSNGIADSAILYRIVELPDPGIADYLKAQYFDDQSFDLTSPKTKTKDGWLVFDNTTGTEYVQKGDGLYYKVTDGLPATDPADPQPKASELTPHSSDEYWTVDKGTPYQAVEVKNEHTPREVYIDLTKFWNDATIYGVKATDGNDYARRKLTFVLHGETADGPVDLNGDDEGYDREIIIEVNESDDKADVTGDKTIDGYTIYKDSSRTEYALVNDDSTHEDGYYPVSGETIDYESGPATPSGHMTPVPKGDGTYKIDDNNFGALIEHLSTHEGGKPITYTITEKIGGIAANDNELPWTTTGGTLNPVKNSKEEIIGYTTQFTNTPVIDNDVKPLPLTIEKRDKLTGAVLEDATFTVYTNTATKEKAAEYQLEKIDGKQVYTNQITKYIKKDDNKYYEVNESGVVATAPADPQPDERSLKESYTGSVEDNEVTTDAAGQATITFKAPGTYYVMETEAPAGYNVDPTTYTFVVDEKLNSIRLQSADVNHETKWWKKLYDLLFGDGTTEEENWEPTPDKDGGTLTVDDDPIRANILINKVWDDKDDQDGLRKYAVEFPEVKIQKTTDPADEDSWIDVNSDVIPAPDKTIPDHNAPLIVDQDNYYTWDNLPAYENGKLLTYRVIEFGGKLKDNATFLPDGDHSEETAYSWVAKTATSDEEEFNIANINDPDNPTPRNRTVTVTNKHIPEKIKLSVSKDWADDDEDTRDRRAANITLYKTVNGAESVVEILDGAVPLDDETEFYTWEGLPAYEDGYPVTYRIEESPVEHYATTYKKVYTDTSGTSVNTDGDSIDSSDVERTWDEDTRDETTEGTINIRNANLQELKVAKTWVKGSNANITYKLYRTTSTDPDVIDWDQARTGTPSVIDPSETVYNWTPDSNWEEVETTVAFTANLFGTSDTGDRKEKSVPSLPKADANGNPYTYRVWEDADATRYEANQISNTEVVNTNLHAEDGVANVNVVKELQGRPWNDNDKFYFKIEPYEDDGTIYHNQGAYGTDADGNKITDPANVPMPAAGNEIQETDKNKVQVGAIGRNVGFDSIEFTTAQVDKDQTAEYYYKVYEVYDASGTSLDDATNHTGKKNGITYAGEVDSDFLGLGSTFKPTEHTLRIVVSSDSNGKITTDIYWDGATSHSAVPVYTNNYDASAEVHAHIIKDVMGREITGDDEFNFTITNIAGAPMRATADAEADTSTQQHDAGKIDPNDGTKVTPASNNYNPVEGNGGNYRAIETMSTNWIKVGDLAQKTSDDKATDTFIYQITENAPNAGIKPSKAEDDDLTFDERSIYVKLVATDNLDGTLNIEKSYWYDAACTSNPVHANVLVSKADGSIAPAGSTPGEEYKYVPAAIFINSQTVDIPVVKEWTDGPAVEDVTLHLERKLIPLNQEEGLTYSGAESAPGYNNKGWETVGNVTIAPRGDFVDTTGAIITEDKTYEDVEGFNKDLPKYVTVDGTTYRAVYKLIEDKTSDAYSTTYRSKKGGTETDKNQVFLDGETLIVTNKVVAKNEANIAAVKQLMGRQWLDRDDFPFTLVPEGKGTYDNDGKYSGKDTSDEAKASVPMPKNDSSRESTTTDAGTADAVATTHAKKSMTTVDPNGGLERLARFGAIDFDISKLTWVKNHYEGDFFYIMKETIPEGATQNPDGTYTKDGITYDGTSHNVHVKVTANRTDVLYVQIAYDEETVGDVTKGTQFTPVYTNKYDATAEFAQDINKYIMGRAWKDTDVFDFRMTALGGAPFEDADRSEFPPVDTHDDDERESDLEAGYAIHSARGAHVKRMNVSDTTEEIQKLTMPKIEFRLSELNKTVTVKEAGGLGALTYSNGEPVPAGTAYGQFVYSFEETNDYLKLKKVDKDVKDLIIDPDTEYVRVTVIDKGDGTLDYKTEVFEDRYCSVPRYKPGTHDPATSPTFVNQLKRKLSITKAWADTPNSDVVMKLQWSLNGENWYDVSEATFLAGQPETKTIAKDATGDALTVTWTDLPAYANIVSVGDQTADDIDMDDLWVYYTITEDSVNHVITRYSEEPYVEGESYKNTEKYKTTVNDANPFKTEAAPSGESYDERTYADIINQLYVTNWRTETEGTAKVGVVKQYIGKVWENETFTFEMTPVKSKLGSATEYTTYEDQVEAHETNPKVKVMPTLSNNKATADTGTDTVSVNEHAANFNDLVIKLSDLVVGEDGKEKGEFIYEIKEVIPDGAVEMTEGGKTYFVKKDDNGNIIKYTTDTNTVKIIAVDDGGGDIDITVSYNERNPGEFVPVYTNYAMMPTPVDGTKEWHGGKKAEHQNGTVEIDEETGEIKSDPEPSDNLKLKLKRKLTTSDGIEETLSTDDAGRDLVVVWVKENPAQPEKPTGYWINSETEEKITDAEYQAIQDEEEKAKYSKEMTPEVPASIDTQTGDDPDSTEKGNSGPYTYTIKAEVTEGGVTKYEDPLLNVCNKAGYEYEYYITETSVPTTGYSKSEDGMDVVNTNNEKDKLKVTKTWNDAQDAEGLRPDKVIVHLYKEVIVPAEEGGEATTKTVQVEVDKKTITKQEGDDKDIWSTGVVFEDLPLYDSNGNVIKYFVLEEGMAGYTGTYAANSRDDDAYKDVDNLEKIELDGDTTAAPQFIDIKNSLTPETSEVKVEKEWLDNDNVDGIRPDEVTVELYARVWDNDNKEYSDEAKAQKQNAQNSWTDVESLTLKKSDGWKGSWTNLPAIRNGRTVLYSVKEVTTDGNIFGTDKYDVDYVVTGDQVDGFKVTNTHKQLETTASVIKNWDDNGNALNTRPRKLKMQLMRKYLDKNGQTKTEAATYVNGTTVKSEMSADDEDPDSDTWKRTVKHLPQKINVNTGTDEEPVYVSRDITYFWKETVPTGYTASVASGDDTSGASVEDGEQTVDNGKTITNTVMRGTLTVIKTWDDQNDVDGSRPKANAYKNMLTLYEDNSSIDRFDISTGIQKSAEDLTGADRNKTKVIYTGVPIYNSEAEPISYSIEEAAIGGYTITVEPAATELAKSGDEWTGQIALTNKHVPGTTSLTVTKKWDDDSNKDNVRPTVAELKATMKLWADDVDKTETYADDLTVVDNGNGTFTVTWANLPAKKGSGDDSEDIVYSATEDLTDAAESFDYYGNPSYKNFFGKPQDTDKVYENGTITNKQMYRDVEVTNVWVDRVNDLDDDELASGIRPESITVSLTDANGNVLKDADGNDLTKVIEAGTPGENASDYKTATVFEKVPIYKADGTTKETVNLKVNNKDSDQVSNYTTKIDNSKMLITNIYKVGEITGTKIWRDDDRTHNNEAEVALKVHWIKNAGTDAEETGTVPNPHIDWNGNKYTVTGLPESDNEGNIYTYRVTEDTVNGYDVPVYDNSEAAADADKNKTNGAYNGGKVINSALTSITLTKKWDDAEYFSDEATASGVTNEYERPDVTFTVTATASTEDKIDTLITAGFVQNDTEKTKYTKEVTLRGGTAENITEWIEKIDKLPMYDQDGEKIEYVATETDADGDTTPDGFIKDEGAEDTEVSNKPKDKKENGTLNLTILKTDGTTEGDTGLNGAEFTVYQSNGRTEATSEMVAANPVATSGEDADAGKATVSFKKPGTYVIKETKAPAGYALSEKTFTVKVDEELESITLTKETDPDDSFWTWLYKLLFNGDKPESMSGDDTHGYTLKVDDDPLRAEVLVDKVWDDKNDQDGLRKKAKDENALPKVKLQYKSGEQWLDADDTILGTQKGTKTVPDKDGKISGGRTYTWKDIPAYLDGEKVEYRVIEIDKIEGYENPTYDKQSFTLSNTAGTEAENAEVTVTNKYEPETASVKVSKLWNDINNLDDIRVDELSFKLTSDNGYEKTLDLDILTEVDDGAEAIASPDDAKWIKLPVYKNGEKIKYTLTETTKIKGYTAEYTGTDAEAKNVEFTLSEREDGDTEDKIYTVTVTNVHVPDARRIWVKKEWNDNDDQDGLRTEVKITLKEADGSEGHYDGKDKDGNSVEDLKLNSGNNYRGSFNNLKAVDDSGKIIKYTVEENGIPAGYDSDPSLSGSGTHADPFVVTNSRNADTISVTATKRWTGDAEFKDETRKDVTLHLIGRKGDGIAWDGGSQTIEVQTDPGDNEDAGTATWTGLPRRLDGEDLTWEVYEDAVPGYAASVSGGTPDENGNVEFTITNTYVGAVAEVTATKIWYDDNNRDGIRTDVYFQLYRSVGYDGEEEAVGDPVMVEVDASAADGEEADTVTWDNLPEVIAETDSETTKETVYNAVEPEGTENPSDEEWYELQGDKHVLTEDTEVDAEKTYYEQGTEEVTSESTTERAVIYTVKEVDKDGNVTAPEGYESVVTQTSAGEFVISNIHAPKTTELSVQKIWIDNDDIEGFRPDHVKFRIKNGEDTVREVVITTEDEGSGWNSGVYTFTGLTLNENGEPIDYKVVELDSDGETELDGSEGHDATSYGYTVSVSGEGTAENPVVVTNTHNVGGKGTLTVTKAWEGDEKHKKETRGDVKLHLIKVIDGARTDAGQDKTIEFDPSEPDKAMTAKWTDLPTSEDGKPVVYTVEEYDVPQGYKASVSDTSVSGEDMTLTVTNTYSETPAFGEDVIYIDPLNPNGKMVLKSNTYDTHSEAEEAAKSQSGAPTVGEHKNYKFTGWAVNYDENGNFVLVATYSEIPQTTKPTTSYIDPQSGKPLLISEETDDPSSVKVPKDPKHDNLVFVGWVKTTDVAGNTIFVAKYECKCEGGNGQQCDDTSGGGNGKGAGGSSKNAGVNTGDDNLLYFWITLFFFAAATLAFTTMRRRREYHRAYDNSGSR